MEEKEKTPTYPGRQHIQEVLEELEFSLSLLEPPLFLAKPERPSTRKRDNSFSGIIVSYKGVIGFVPFYKLEKPYRELGAAEQLIKKGGLIEVYLLRISEGRGPNEWETPIFSMFPPS